MCKKARKQVPMDKITSSCRKWKITEFSLLGSVLRDDFCPDSNIDIVVSFHDNAGWDLFDWLT